MKKIFSTLLAFTLIFMVTIPVLAMSTASNYVTESETKYLPGDNETRYTVTTYNPVTGQYITSIHSIPRYVEDVDHPIDTNWYSGKIGEYTAGNNLLTAYVMNTKVTVGDPWVDRGKDGKLTKATDSKQAVWNPKVFLNGNEVKLTVKAAILISGGTLEWDYGICKRQLKLVAGGIVEEYIFNEDPGGDIIIKSSSIVVELAPSGYYAADAQGVNLGGFEVVGDEKRVPATAFDNDSYPVVVDDTFLTSGSSWQVPVNWNSADNSIECIGGGHEGKDPNQGCQGGGGGGYSKITNLTLTPESSVPYQVGGEGGDTYFKDVATVLAKGGATQVGGQAAAGVGTVKYSGGDGGNAVSVPYGEGHTYTKGGGGGGAAGMYGDGEDGEDATEESGAGTGGDGDAGYGGTGGVANQPGEPGIEWEATHGSGGGGGGGSFNTGGDGGLYGAGGGGGANNLGYDWDFYDEGRGVQGLIVIIYTPLAPPTVTTQAVTDILGTTATGHGNITSVGDAATCDKRGIVYGTTSKSDPGGATPPGGYDDYEEEVGTFGIGAFTRDLIELIKNQTYYARAYARSTYGYNYGNEVTFDTLVTAPSIDSEAATYVERTTARLNSTVTDDGGELCDVRFGYGDETRTAANFELYDTKTDWVLDTYTTGQHPYVDVADLTLDTDYFYRVQIKNSEGTTDTSDDEIQFTTDPLFSPPTNLKAYPASTAVDLTWTKGDGATYTMIRYSEVGYPADQTEGTFVVLTVLASYTIEDLTPGHTYYIVAISKSGVDYSDTVEVMATTTAGAAAEGEPGALEMPPTWFQSPNYAVLSGIPFYGQVNALFDAYEIPRAGGWFFATILGCIAFGIIVLAIAKNPMPAAIALSVALSTASLIKLLPLYMMAFTVIFIIGAWQLSSRRTI